MSPKNKEMYAYTKLVQDTTNVMNYLGIPKEGTDNEINQTKIFSTLYNFIQGENQSWRDHFHSLKLLRGMLFVVDYLGIKDNKLAITLCAGGGLHDIGKIPMLDLFRKRDFINEDFKRKSDHTRIDYIRQAFWPKEEDRNRPIFDNPLLEAIIERHHFNRVIDSYPKKPLYEETPQIKLYSSLIGIHDEFDAISTRINNSTQLTEEDKKAGRMTPSGKTAKERLLQLYGHLELDLDESGEIISGEELIEDMYKHIFMLSESSEEERILHITHN